MDGDGEKRVTDCLKKEARSGRSGVCRAISRLVYVGSGRSLGVMEGLEGRLSSCQRAGDAVASGTGVKGLCTATLET